MPNPNISAALAPGDKITMKNNVDNNKNFIASFGVNLTPQQRKELFKMGSDSVSFVNDCLLVAQNHPSTIPADMTLIEYQKDVVLFNDLNELELHHDPYFEMISDTKMAVGSEAMKQSNRIYATVKELAKNNSTFETIRQNLSQRYALLQGPRTKTGIQKVLLAPSSSVSIVNVVEGSSFKNDGPTDLKLCNGAMPTCTDGKTVVSGTTVKIDAGITTITVTNLNSTVNGSFSVKTEVE